MSKPDATYRMVVDYRQLNSQTVMDNFPLCRIQDSLESFGSANAKFFSTLDLQSGYHQVPIEEKSKQYTAVVTHDGLFEFNRLSFGLANAPDCFSRLMTRVLQGLNWDVALLYLDDIICFSRDFIGLLVNLRAIFDRLRNANLTLKPSKCIFGHERIKFLGHIVSSKGIEPMDDKCQAVRDFPQPRKVKDIRSFLGLAGYYHKFIKDYSKIAAPLTNLTKREKSFQWSDSCEQAFQAPILAYPDYQKDYILYTDASSSAIGMVLSQEHNGRERVISYGGKKLSPAEQKYSTTERECLGVIVTLKHFEHYLRGVHVTIVTDHAALKWMLSQNEPRGRISRWVAYLQQFNYTIKHQPGKNIGRRSYEDSETHLLADLDEQLDDKILIDKAPERANVATIVFKG